jgi:outer membrane protein OmpA-like peptidoglycan-associated protein
LLAQEQRPVNYNRIENVPFRLGVYGGYGINYHNTQANVFDGGNECGAFGPGDGRGPIFGILGEFPLMGQWLDLTANFNYARRDGAFAEAYTGGLPILDPNSGEYVSLERRHAYTSQLSYLLIELGLRFQPSDDFPLYLRTSGVLGLFPSHAGFKQTEEILSPQGVVYPDSHEAIRTVSSGDISDVQPWLGLAGTLGYTVPLGMRVSASPEISYYYALNDVTTHYKWRLNSAQAGIALKWIFGDPPPEPIVEQPVPMPEPEPVVYPQVSLATVTPQKVGIRETIVTETFPILPYIFFDSASADLAARYTRISPEGRGEFDENSLPHRSLGTYYSILNIIGSRMTRNPGAAIVLKGTTDGQEEPAAAAASVTARRRAQIVRDYLVNVWKIDPARIEVKASPTPTFPSNMLYAEGAQENRRVEITATSDDILQPIIHERFYEHTSEPDAIPFALDCNSPSGIANWQLKVSAGSSTVWETQGVGQPRPTISWKLDEPTIDMIARQFIGQDSLRCELSVSDNSGSTAVSNFAIPAEKLVHPYEISRLSLIVFDFDKADISQQNRRMVSSFISRSLTPLSTAEVTGSTDRLGEFDHNQQLSQSRAIAVHDLIVGERPEATITDTRGIGPSKLIYDNDLPEGRYYCRTVSVQVQTPLDSSQSPVGSTSAQPMQ